MSPSLNLVFPHSANILYLFFALDPNFRVNLWLEPGSFPGILSQRPRSFSAYGHHGCHHATALNPSCSHSYLHGTSCGHRRRKHYPRRMHRNRHPEYGSDRYPCQHPWGSRSIGVNLAPCAMQRFCRSGVRVPSLSSHSFVTDFHSLKQFEAGLSTDIARSLRNHPDETWHLLQDIRRIFIWECKVLRHRIYKKTNQRAGYRVTEPRKKQPLHCHGRARSYRALCLSRHFPTDSIKKIIRPVTVGIRHVFPLCFIWAIPIYREIRSADHLFGSNYAHSILQYRSVLQEHGWGLAESKSPSYHLPPLVVAFDSGGQPAFPPLVNRRSHYRLY